MEKREKKETESTNCDTSKDKNVINNDDLSSKNKVDSQAVGLSSDKESQEACKVVKNGDRTRFLFRLKDFTINI